MRVLTGRHRFAAAFAIVCAILMATSHQAFAQYFGQNKVQYRELSFQVLATDHFDIYFYPAERDSVDTVARMAERWYTRLSKVFDHELRGRQPLILYASPVDFQQTNVIPGDIGESTGGVTEPVRRRIVLPLAGPLADTDHVIGHELTHAFQFDLTTQPNAPPGQNGAESLPLWFIEGMAEYLSLGPVDPNTAMWLRDAVQRNDLPAISKLDNPKYFPYRWGQAFWAYVGARWGDNVIGHVLAAAAAGQDVRVGFQKVLGVTREELSSAWQAAIRADEGPVLAATTPLSETGHAVVSAGNEPGALNVGPSISPDGRKLALLSSRDLLSIDLYVADASTGAIQRKLTSTATNPHFSSLQFIYSAGAWDHASRRLAISAITNGRPEIVIFNAENGSKEREIPLPSLDQVSSPSWSPRDDAICFSGMTQGVTDLFVYDLSQSALRRLTNDAYADLQPSWSPDGTRIAFATDRFSSALDTLAIGHYRLAEIDPAGGRIEQVATFNEGDSLNPQWGGNGQEIYFISDQNGVSNVYRAPANGGSIMQLTNVGTGVSGITMTSPALSVATGSDVAAFSVFVNGGYGIYTIAPSQRAVALRSIPPGAGALPPRDRSQSEVAELLADPAQGLPAPQRYPTRDYSPKLSLEGIGQPSVALGVSRFGPAVGGGISMYFSDMLRTRTLATAIDVNSEFGTGFSVNDIGAEAAYFNQAHRWEWAVAGGQTPYLSGGFDTALGVSETGEPLEVDRTIIFRQTERSGTVAAAYPFSRARRVEFQAGATQIAFDQTVRTTVSSLASGQVLSDARDTTSVAPSVTLGTASAALVWDTATYGATSPVAGSRYRIEAAPAFGTINFTNVLADYRRYFMPAPFYTLAVRAMHNGRYGSGAEDPRLFPMYLGYPSLVRGYDINSFDASDCVPSATSSCPAIDRLIGSRMLVGNVEFRVPVLRPFTGTSARMYGPVPVELAAFADGGVAWNAGERPSLLGGSRDGVWSAGGALRVNVFGFLVAEFDLVRPFQRPSRGWVFQFNLVPGF